MNKIGHVVEEADESVYWLELITAAAICRESQLVTLRREAAELSAIFNQSQLTAKQNVQRLKDRRSRKAMNKASRIVQ